MLTTSLLQVVNRLLIVQTRYQQACRTLFQQVVKSLQMTNCNKSDFNFLEIKSSHKCERLLPKLGELAYLQIQLSTLNKYRHPHLGHL